MSPELVLGRTEGARLLRNPIIWLSFVLTATWVRSARRGEAEAEDQLLLLVGFGVLLPGFVMVVAVVLATLRGRIEHTEELLGTLAVSPDRRSVGHAVSTLACGAIGLLAVIATYVALWPGDPLGSWSADDRAPAPMIIPRPTVAQVLQGPLAIIAVSAFVIACVRWVPTWLVVVPLAFMVFVQGLFAGIFHSLRASGWRWLYPLNTGVVNDEWVGCATEDAACNLPVSGFDATTPWIHLGYLASVAVWFTVVAVLRHRRDRSAWLWFGAASVVLVGFVVAQFLVADGFVAVQ